jgi:hypothetical protein
MLFLTFLGPYSNNGCDLLLGTGTSGAHIVTHQLRTTPLAVLVSSVVLRLADPEMDISASTIWFDLDFNKLKWPSRKSDYLGVHV